nr:immunoglobulin heavy chain junction region [Macaca mulatta]
CARNGILGATTTLKYFDYW